MHGELGVFREDCLSVLFRRVPPQGYFFILSNRQYSERAAALYSMLSNGNPKGAVIGVSFLLVTFSLDKQRKVTRQQGEMNAKK